jgi:hypothetical protein
VVVRATVRARVRESDALKRALTIFPVG